MSGSFDNEEWRDLPDWEGRYQVSSLGRVRTKRPDGWFLRKLGYGACRGKQSYLQISLPRRAGQKTQRSITLHKAVAAIFIGPRPEHAVIRHLDGNRHNNAATNLAYGTPEQNVADDVERQVRRGSNNGRAKLTEREVKAIKRLLAHGLSMAMLSRAFDISEASVQFIRDGRNWAYVTI